MSRVRRQTQAGVFTCPPTSITLIGGKNGRIFAQGARLRGHPRIHANRREADGHARPGVDGRHGSVPCTKACSVGLVERIGVPTSIPTKVGMKTPIRTTSLWPQAFVQFMQQFLVIRATSQAYHWRPEQYATKVTRACGS